MMDLDLRQVRSFMDVADLGSFSAAADKAGLTQPAISLHIRLLEKQLGVRLIERVGRRARRRAGIFSSMQDASPRRWRMPSIP
jgi:DNA-binding transcriptional LysR family regulator